MQTHLLITEELKPIPNNIKVIFEVKDIQIYCESRNEFIRGDNTIVEGEKEDIIAWLKPLNGFWVGSGVPQMESFSIMHIKDDL